MAWWLLFALASPLFWAIVHIFDAHCVEKIFDKPWMGVITSSLASTVAFLALPFLLPHIEWKMPEPGIMILALGAGALIQCSQACYFQALSYSDAGIVSAYWNMTPIFVPLASVAILGRILETRHYFGILILILASAAFCLVDREFAARRRSFFLMLAAAGMQAVALLIEDLVYANTQYVMAYFLVICGLVLMGALPLALPSVRTAISENSLKLKKAIPLLIAIEVANLIALGCSQRAIDLGLPSLVAAVETTIPAYIFGVSFLLLLYPKTRRFGDPEVWNRLPVKCLLIGCMAFGVWAVSSH